MLSCARMSVPGLVFTIKGGWLPHARWLNFKARNAAGLSRITGHDGDSTLTLALVLLPDASERDVLI